MNTETLTKTENKASSAADLSFSRRVRAELSKIVPIDDDCLSSQLSALSSFRIGHSGHIRGSADTLKAQYAGLPHHRDISLSHLTGPPMDEEMKRAYLRGAYLAAGSMSDPEKSYHLEIVCQSARTAEWAAQAMEAEMARPKIMERKGRYVAYIKEADQIVETLGRMGASKAVIAFENIRIIKDMRNSVNRKVNCEAANIEKTIDASLRQVRDIEKIQRTIGLGKLPRGLREAADLRLTYPQLPLSELCQRCSPPVGKSGMNHRFRKLEKIASEIIE